MKKSKKNHKHKDSRKGKISFWNSLKDKISNSIIVESFRTITSRFIFAMLFDVIFIIASFLSFIAVGSLIVKELSSMMPALTLILNMGGFKSINLETINSTQLKTLYDFGAILPKVAIIAVICYVLFIITSTLFSMMVYRNISGEKLGSKFFINKSIFNIAYLTLFIYLFFLGMKFTNVYLLIAYLFLLILFTFTFYLTSSAAFVYEMHIRAIKNSFILLFRNLHSFLIAYVSLLLMIIIALNLVIFLSITSKIAAIVLAVILTLFMVSWLRNYFIVAYKRRFVG